MWIEIKRIIQVLLVGAVVCFATNASAQGSQKAVIQFTVNGKSDPRILNTGNPITLYRVENSKRVSTGIKSPISPKSSVEFDLPDTKSKYLLQFSIAGSSTPVFSKPIQPGFQKLDLPIAHIKLQGDQSTLSEYVNKNVYLFTKDSGKYKNLWQKSKIFKTGEFFIYLPGDADYVAGVELKHRQYLYSGPLKAGVQKWDPKANRPPVINIIEKQTIHADDKVNIKLTASDIDKDTLELKLLQAPDFVLLRDWHDNAGSLVFQPKVKDKGKFEIIYGVSDGEHLTKHSFELVVRGAQNTIAETINDTFSNIVGKKEKHGPAISAIWVNNGEDKVTQDELRKSKGYDVTSSVWDGTNIKLFGARNEMVNFNLIIEAAKHDAEEVSVELDGLIGPEGFVISSRQANKDDPFDFINRNIELFFVRYLQILGVSQLAYNPQYDERHVPAKLRLPFSSKNGKSRGKWENRPNANKYYPDIAVPLEVIGSFPIAAKSNQSIWADIYIPRNAPAGTYHGTVKVFESNKQFKEIPLALKVIDFTLPDESTAKTMVYFNEENLNDRYFGKKWPIFDQEPLVRQKQMAQVWYNHHKVAHRHKISLIDDGKSINPGRIGDHLPWGNAKWMPVLNGELFTDQYGYQGPGEGVSSGVYSIGTYGGWKRGWDEENKEDLWKKSDLWVTWFDEVFPNVEYFLYLLDEPKRGAYEKVERWARWIDENPGPGRRLKTLTTGKLQEVYYHMPSVDIAFTWWGDKEKYAPIVMDYLKSGKPYWAYNGHRPWAGSYAIEDEGVAMRTWGWIQFKHTVARWFYWQATHYKNSSYIREETNVFETACTFGRCNDSWKDKYGKTGHNYNNGDGVLFYPGIERRYPQDSYGLLGPITSLRLKHWRRGIQDHDYLTMAAQYDPQKVKGIVQRIIPKVLWEVGVTDPKDPSYVHADISWSINPDVWEKARRELAEIIIKGQSKDNKNG